MATTEAMTPDLQRIVEALKACRERYRIVSGARFDTSSVWDESYQPFALMVFQGTPDACHEWRDARCAEAMVRAISEPGEAVVWTIASGLDHPSVYMGGPSERSRQKAARIWPAAIDAILGETQPGGARQGPEMAESLATSTAHGGALPGSPAPTSETQP